MGMQPAIICVKHHKPVSLSGTEPGPLICHQDGQYCRSEQFTIDTLNRAQVMALLIVARGWQAMNLPASGDTRP